MLTRYGLRRALFATSVLILLGFDAPAAQPQSLGDVARRETERRKEATRTPGRIYTNEDLGAVDPPSTPAQPVQTDQAPAAEEPTETVTAAAPTGPTVLEEDAETHKLNVRTTAPAREKRDEQYWRARAKDVREQLAKVSADLTAAQASLAALDGGPKTPAATRERQVVAALVERLQSEVRYRQLDVTKLQMHAESDKVPADWIR
ncbi:MAG: hypothetical protein ACRD3C_20820 [Vicinamibacterales bacterium]